MDTPAQINMPAPARLVEALAAIGYQVELRITRTPVATVDPGSDTGPIDAPIDDTAAEQISATLKAYDAADSPAAGPRFVAPV